MKATKASDLRTKTVAELHAMIAEEKAAMYQFRRDLAFRKTTDTAGYKTRRHNVARLLTLIGEKERAAKKNAA
ncbi:MAG: 50S ribosomal protein L29 [Armatimonadota bacterium]